MGRLTVLISVCLVVHCGHEAVAKKMSAASKAELINFAKDQLAPFTNTALGRLHGEIFGSGRAARSSDVIIVNKTNKKFKLGQNSCQWGGFSSNLFPEAVLPPKSSVVYGIESNGFMSGVTCTVRYDVVQGGTRSGEYVSFFVDNPYIGHNVERSSKSGSLKVVSTLGQGNNNQIRYIID